MKSIIILSILNIIILSINFFKIFNINFFYIYLSSAFLLLILLIQALREMSLAKKRAIAFEDLKVKISSLSGVSDQIASTSSNLSEGAMEQAEQLQQSVSAMDEINATLLKNKDSASDSLDETKRCLRKVSEGQSSMNELDSAFAIIKSGNKIFEETVTENNKSFDKNKEVISEIHEKTKIINDIVFQTKLLSFNASVEAARAGEHGKGFSVVAEEIGNLASMSGSAAKEIASILDIALATVNTIVDNSTTTVTRLIQEGAKNIEHGTHKVSESLKSFQDLSDSVKKVATSIDEIAGATAEQSIGVNEVTKSINVLEQNNQRSLLVAKQSSEIAISLNEEFRELDATFDSAQSLFYLKGAENFKLPEIVWSDKFLIGVDSMDEEHKELISIINKLIRSLNRNVRDEILEKFQDLKEYTVFHFDDEEKFMERVNYPDIVAHKKIHVNMIAQFLKFEENLKSDTLDKKKFLAFLKNWLISHILGVDSQYAKYA